MYLTVTIAAIALAGCSKKPEAAPPVAVDTTAKAAAAPMAMAGMSLMPAVRSHLDSLGQASPSQMAAMMPAHQDLMSRMMDAMGKDMRGMNMSPDATWTSLSDSVRQDLAELPALNGAAYTARFHAHLDRVRRLLAQHEAMTKM